MKKNYIFLTFVFVFACILNMQAQSFETDIAKVLSQDETLLSFNKNEARNISGILASGNIKFTSSNGYVRILVADQYRYEKLVYESFPLLAFKEGKDRFELMGFETGKIKDFVPEKVHILISDAMVEHLKITVSGLSAPQQAPSASLQARTKTVPLPPTFIDEDTRIKYLIYRLNLELKASGALWRAGDTPFGRLSYEEKKEMYGGTVPNFKGVEYYIGGIIDVDVPDIRKMIALNNNIAQKNLTIAEVGTGSSYEGAVSVINNLKNKEAYSLDVIELPNATNGSPNTLFGNARVQLRMAPQVLSAWNEGGKKGVNIKSTGHPYIQEIVSQNGSLDNIILKPKDIGLVKLSVNFKNVLPPGSNPERHTVLLRQKDKTGKVVGGETFEIIREPRPAIYPQIIKGENGEKVKLSVTGVDEEATYQWFDSNGKMIAEGAEMTCAPTRDETYRVEVTAKKDGYLTSSELLMKAGKGKMKVSPIPVKSELTVSYDLPNGQYELCITGAPNWLNYGKYSIDSTKKEVRINVSHLPQGIYIATITERNGQIKESVKFIKE